MATLSSLQQLQELVFLQTCTGPEVSAQVLDSLASLSCLRRCASCPPNILGIIMRPLQPAVTCLEVMLEGCPSKRSAVADIVWRATGGLLMSPFNMIVLA